MARHNTTVNIVLLVTNGAYDHYHIISGLNLWFIFILSGSENGLWNQQNFPIRTVMNCCNCYVFSITVRCAHKRVEWRLEVDVRLWCVCWCVRIMLSQPDPVSSTAQCIQLPDESCHCDDHTAGGGVSFSQPTHLDNLLVCTQLMATPGTSQVRWLSLELIWCVGFARDSIKDRFHWILNQFMNL